MGQSFEPTLLFKKKKCLVLTNLLRKYVSLPSRELNLKLLQCTKGIVLPILVFFLLGRLVEHYDGPTVCVRKIKFKLSFPIHFALYNGGLSDPYYFTPKPQLGVIKKKHCLLMIRLCLSNMILAFWFMFSFSFF